jgi:hypothetical protein
MVAAGVYKNEEAAIKAMAIEQIERKISSYREQVQVFERQYQHTLDEHSRLLQGKATMADEDEWMDWKSAAVMRDAWQKALPEVLASAA